MIELVAAVPPFGRTTTGMSTPRSEPFDLVIGCSYSFVNRRGYSL